MFLAACIAVYAVSWFVLGRSADPRTFEIAVTLDLTLFIPALYWLLLVRGRGWPLVSIAPVFLASLILASFMLPASRQSTLDAMKYIAAPVEFVLIGILLHRTTRAIRVGRAHGSSDALERMRAAVESVVPDRRAAAILAFESAVLWYAFFSWRTRAAGGSTSQFTYHRKAGYGGVVAALLLALAVEIVPVHALIGRWNGALAWIVTVLSLYGAVWLIGDLRAIRLRPIMLQNDRLDIRFGLRWSLSVPLRQITSVRMIGGSLVYDRVDLRAVLPGARRIAIQLDAPVEASGPYGLMRRVSTIELGVDDPERLLAALTPASRGGAADAR